MCTRATPDNSSVGEGGQTPDVHSATAQCNRQEQWHDPCGLPHQRVPVRWGSGHLTLDLRMHNLGPLLHAITLGLPLRDPRTTSPPLDMRLGPSCAGAAGHFSIYSEQFTVPNPPKPHV